MRENMDGHSGGRMALLAFVASVALIAAITFPNGSHAASVGGSGPTTPPGQTAPGSTGGAGKSDAPARSAPGGVPKGAASPAQPAVTTTPAQVLPEPKKPFQIDPAFFDVLYHALLKTDMKAEDEELKAALDETIKLYGSGHHYLWYYQHRANTCAKKQYTTEDQKKAGCIGTDTLNQCSAKLFNECFSHYKNDPFLTYRKKMLESAGRLDKALKAHGAKLKVIPEPK